MAAAALRTVLQGRTLHNATGTADRLTELSGSTIVGVEARGKHLIIHFSNDLAIHSHMGMTGAWHTYGSKQPWRKPAAQAVAALSTDAGCAVCFTPKQFRIVSERALSRDPVLQKLGPDLLGPPIDDAVFVERFRRQRSTEIGRAVMNQTVVAGIGNVYKSELLFLEQIHPRTSVETLTDQQLLQLRDRIVRLMRRNLDGRRRTTRFAGDRFRTWVYRRKGEGCLKCGATIEMIRQGDLTRSTYFCPTCQPPAASS